MQSIFKEQMNILNRLKTPAVVETRGVLGIIDKISDEQAGNSEIHIRDTFTDNYDILLIHRRIIKKLEGEKTAKCPKLLIEINRLKELANLAKRPIDKYKYTDEIARLETVVESYETESKILEYRSGVEKLLEIYTKTHDSKDPIEIQRRIEAIEEYISVANKYAKIEVVRILPEYYLCDTCGFDLHDVDTSEDAIICPCCETVIKKYVDTREVQSGNSDTFSSAGSGSVVGDDSRNFRDTLKRFQGKEIVSIPAALYASLDDYFHDINYSDGDYFREMAPLASGIKNGTSKKIMSEALKKTGNSSYYENEAYICRHYWGWVLPDLSMYEDIIIELYFKFQACYQGFKGFDRKSSLATQVILWLILSNLGIPCSRNDFRLVEIDKTVTYYRQVLEECTKKLGWKNIPL